jgi:membrane protein required for colicin V production
MVIDIIVVVLVIMAVIKGWQRGLIIALFSVIAFIVGLAAALKLSAAVAGYLKDSVNVSARWLPVLSFVIVFISVVLLIRLAANLLQKTVELAMLGWVNRAGGIILYIVLYMLGLSVVLFFAQQVQLIKQPSIEQSVTWPVVQPWGPWVINGLGKWIPVFKDMFKELEDFFVRMAHNKAQ